MSTAARAAVQDGDLFVSAVTGYELAQKYRLGRMPEALPLVDAYSSAVRGLLDRGHRDPFDRILAAQAVGDDLTLVTSDRAFGDGSPSRLRTQW